MKKTFNKNLYVAKNKDVEGFINLKINKNSIEILNLGVRKKYQGKGVGTEFLKFTEKIANKNKIKKIKVETLTYEDEYEPYKLTREFYLKNGFVYKYIKKAKKKGCDDLVVMEKILK